MNDEQTDRRRATDERFLDELVSVGKSMDDAVGGLDRVSTKLEGMADRAEKANPTKRRWPEIVLLTFLGIGVSAVLVMAVLIYRQGDEAKRLAAESARLAAEVKHSTEVIEDCTTEGGGCYEEGQQRTAGAVTTIVDEVVRQVEELLATRFPQVGTSSTVVEREPPG